MKRLILKISILILPVIAGTSPAFTQTSASKTVSRSETVAFLILQNKNANEVIKTQNDRILALEAEVAAEKENSLSIGKSYEAAKAEITSLKASNEALSRAVKINEDTIALLQADNARQKEKVKKANKEKWRARAVGAVVIFMKFAL